MAITKITKQGTITCAATGFVNQQYKLPLKDDEIAFLDELEITVDHNYGTGAEAHMGAYGGKTAPTVRAAYSDSKCIALMTYEAQGSNGWLPDHQYRWLARGDSSPIFQGYLNIWLDGVVGGAAHIISYRAHIRVKKVPNADKIFFQAGLKV